VSHENWGGYNPPWGVWINHWWFVCKMVTDWPRGISQWVHSIVVQFERHGHSLWHTVKSFESKYQLIFNVMRLNSIFIQPHNIWSVSFKRMISSTELFKMASCCGDGYVLSRRATDYDDDVNVLACKLSWAWRAWSASRKCFTWSNQPKVSKVAPRVAFRLCLSLYIQCFRCKVNGRWSW